MHVWGCPVYVLHKSISDGKKIPRWQPRSHRCVYMGVSTESSTNVPLVLDPLTGSITTKYHVVFDDHFATITSDGKDLPDFNSDAWSKVFGDSSLQYHVDEAEEPAPNITLNQNSHQSQIDHERNIASDFKYKASPVEPSSVLSLPPSVDPTLVPRVTPVITFSF